MLTFERFNHSIEEWGRTLAGFADHQVFQTPAWLAFLAETQGGTPVIAVLKDGPVPVGYFAGLVVRRWGVRILGSPFPGWTTPYMGIRVVAGVSRSEAARALVDFAFEELRCAHVEFTDPAFESDDGSGVGLTAWRTHGYEIDLSPSEDQLFDGMTSATRRCLRRGRKLGVVTEEARDDAFADEYYAQLEDVFAKQRLVPPYGKERVRALIRHLLPTGVLLLLRARDAHGRCIATGIFPALNRHMFFWGGASWRDHQLLRPNEAIMWHAMRYWKQRGIRFFDMCGGGAYKEKYGAHRVSLTHFAKSRHRILLRARDAGRRLFSLRQKLIARLRGLN